MKPTWHPSLRDANSAMHHPSGRQRSYFMRGDALWQRTVDLRWDGLHQKVTYEREEVEIGTLDVSRGAKAALEPLRDKFEHPFLYVLAKKHVASVLHQRKAKSTWDVQPDEIVRWGEGRIAELSKDEPCVDNQRIARCGSSSQKRRYRAQQARGCCGFADVREVGPDGNLYMLGWNYGH